MPAGKMGFSGTLTAGSPGTPKTVRPSPESHILLKGIIPALVTPFAEDGSVNVEVTRRLVDFHLDHGATGFYVCGNTGEGAQMTVEERKIQAKAVVDAARGRPVLVHVGGCAVEEAIELAVHAKEINATGTSAMPCADAPLTEIKDIAAYFEAIGGAAELPFYVYWVPGGLSSIGAAEFLQAMEHVPNIAGIKYTDKDFFKFEQIMTLAAKVLGKPLNCLTGPDEMMVAGLAMGSHGAIGSTYNLNIKMVVECYDAFQKGDTKAAQALQAQANEIIAILIEKTRCHKVGTNIIAGIKAVYKARGFDCGEARAFQLTGAEQADLNNTIESLRYEFKTSVSWTALAHVPDTHIAH